MPTLNTFVTCEVLAWLRGGTSDDIAFFAPQADNFSKGLPAKQSALETCEVDRAVCSWTEVCFVQFLCVRATDCFSAIKAAPQIPLLAGVGSQRQGSSTRVAPISDGGITHAIAPHPRPSTGQLDVRRRPPTKQIPKAIEFASRARRPARES